MRQDILDEVIDGEPRYNILDNSDGTKSIELANYVIKHGTPINKELFMRVFGMNNYELLSNVQEDISENTTNKVYGQFASTPSSGTTWTGYCIGNTNTGETWKFSISSNRTLNFNNDNLGTSSSSGVMFYLNGDSTSSIADVNKILSGTTGYSSNTYMRIYGYSGTIVYFTWDCYKPRSASFSLSGTHEGSTDGSTWITADSSTPYRYHRLKITFSSQSSKNFTSVHINASDTIPKYRNNFTSVNDFSIQECANVITPSFANSNYIAENKINGIPVELILKPNTDYSLKYYGGKIVKTGAKFVTGSFTQSGQSSTHEIVLGFEPDLVMFYAKDNNNGYIACYNRVGSNPTNNQVPAIFTEAYTKGEGGNITDNGFVFNGRQYSSGDSEVIYYIAIKF